MGTLTAEEMNSEFLKNFLTETVYLLEQDAAMPAFAQPQEPVKAHPVGATVSDATPPVAAPAIQKPASIPKLPKVEPVLPKMFELMGENRRGIAILVTLPTPEFQNLPQLEFLNKILAAIGLQPTDVAYVNNVSGAVAQFEKLTEALTANYIISFASRVDTSLPHEKFTLYNPVTIGTVPIVFSQSLKVLEKDVEQKKLLWAALKQVFL